MSVFYLDQAVQKQSVGAIALGSFDGVHLGHIALLQKAEKVSQYLNTKAAALCFSPNPKQFFAKPEKPYFQIYGLKQNLEELLTRGVEAVFVKKFDYECSQMTAVEFLRFLSFKIDFKALVIGFDFKFGKDRAGNQDTIKNWCEENGVELYIVEPQVNEGLKISSTRVKKSLLSGDVEGAKHWLGRNHSYTGEVLSDQGLGRKIGFPTLNLCLSLNTAVAHGVYSSSLRCKGKTYFGLSNVGTRPTVSVSMPHLALETHLLDFHQIEVRSGDKISVELQKFIRAEKKFDTIDQLKSQIKADILTVKSLRGL